jgi:hypothetical protein
MWMGLNWPEVWGDKQIQVVQGTGQTGVGVWRTLQVNRLCLSAQKRYLAQISMPEPGSSVGTVPDYGLDGRGSIPRQRQRIFPLTSLSRPALGPTQPPVQWVPGALCPGVKSGRDVMLTTHPLLVPGSRKSRSYTSSHPKRQLGV